MAINYWRNLTFLEAYFRPIGRTSVLFQKFAYGIYMMLVAGMKNLMLFCSVFRVFCIPNNPLRSSDILPWGAD